jgi:hypothetical protein
LQSGAGLEEEAIPLGGELDEGESWADQVIADGSGPGSK